MQLWLVRQGVLLEPAEEIVLLMELQYEPEADKQIIQILLEGLVVLY
jgi:hypothetical protein